MSRAVTLKRLTLAYDGVVAVRDVDGTFADGSLTAVVGPNGAGKSTLVKTIVGLLRPSSGAVIRDGIGRHDLAYLPQGAAVDRSFPITVLDTVGLGAWRHSGAFRAVGRTMTARAEEALATVGLDGVGDHAIGSLSAGQFQRVLFARLLLQDAPVIILDEPFTAVDARTTEDLLGLVVRWHAEGRTVVAVLHDLEQVRAHFPKTLLIARDQIAWDDTEAALSAANLRQARITADHWDDLAPSRAA